MNKGTVSSVAEDKAVIVPYDAQKSVTFPLAIPGRYLSETGKLKVGDQVIYVTFDDFTGMVLERM